MENKDQNYYKFKKNKSARLKPIRHFFEYILIKIFLITSSLFTIRMNQWFGRTLGRLAYYFAKKDRGIAQYQLDFALPEKKQEEKEQIIRQCFQHLGQTLMETSVIQKLRKQQDQFIHFEGDEMVHKNLANGKGAIFVTGHFGNWELMTIVFEKLDIHGVTVVRGIDAKPLNDILEKIRSSTHLEVIRRGDKSTSRKMLKCFKSNQVLLLALDQDIDAQGYFVDFFGRKARTAKSGASFAIRFGIPIISAFDRRNSDGTHTVHFKEIALPPFEKGEENEIRLTEQLSIASENFIRETPEQWAWFHRRWKHRPESENDKEL
ncbi:MAG: KDO2-lipid IV(A) lauroyltransferase [bacterium]|jgi:KDO2-lipid IV(A) lauroyltransferase